MRRATPVGAAAALVATLLLGIEAPVPASASDINVKASAPAWTTRLLDSGPIRFADISCPTSRVCMAVGAEGTAAIFRTTDSGATWTRQKVAATTPAISAVSCPTTRFCLASYTSSYFGDPVDQGSEGYLETVDGGAHWATGSTVTDGGAATCAGPSRCYTVADYTGPIARTTNGGATWQDLSMRGLESVGLISCVRRSTCFEVGTTSGSGAGRLEFGKIVGFGARVIHVDALPRLKSFYPSELSCPNVSSCALVGNLYNNTGVDVVTTSDGGATWTIRRLPLPPPFGPSTLSCANANYCVVAETSTAPGAVPGAPLTATTENDGRTWSVSTVPYSEGRLSCPSAGACFMVSGNAVLVRTPHSMVWSPIEIPTGRGPLAAVACSSATTCITLGSGVIERSVDGGGTWTASQNGAQLGGLACPTTTICLATGRDPATSQDVIYRSTNAGVTWEPVATTTLTTSHSYYSGIVCGSATMCIATAWSPGTTSQISQFVQTADDGSTWHTYPTPSGQLVGVSCGSSTHCLAVTQTGGNESPTSTVSTSSDAGASWTTAASFDIAVGNVSCTSSTTCWMSGSDVNSCCLGPPTYGPSLIFRSVDGGFTWTQLASLGGTGVAGPPTITCAGMDCQLVSVTDYYPSSGPPEFGLATSVDGGVDWSAASLPDPPTTIGALEVTPSNTWILVGGDSLDGALVVTSP